MTLKGRIFLGIFCFTNDVAIPRSSAGKKGQNKSLAFLFQVFVSVFTYRSKDL
jgi:hypothetical protein